MAVPRRSPTPSARGRRVSDSRQDEASVAAALRADLRPLRLDGAVQPYAWGGDDFIPRLVGRTPAAGHPAAELWLGAHPAGPARASLAGRTASLDAVIATAPGLVLGDAVASRFDATLPYLLKVLDVRAMLSIQAHPTRDQAREGCAREDALGVPRDAPHRTYRDANHKPEMQVALGEFWMLHGFRPLAEVARNLHVRPELGPLFPELASPDAVAKWSPSDERAASRRIFERVMTVSQDAVDRALAPLVSRLASAADRGALEKSSHDFWAARAARQFPLPGGHLDRGLVSIYLLNLLRLDVGEATFVPAGVLHAYLEGRNVELMAASDNVLRGGLTPKHVDVAELLRILTFDAAPPARLAPAVSPGRAVFRPPVEEFALERWDLRRDGAPVQRADPGPTTLLVLDGAATLSWTGASGPLTMSLDRGGVALVPASLPYALHAGRDATVFVATVPPVVAT